MVVVGPVGYAVKGKRIKDQSMKVFGIDHKGILVTLKTE